MSSKVVFVLILCFGLHIVGRAQDTARVNYLGDKYKFDFSSVHNFDTKVFGKFRFIVLLKSNGLLYKTCPEISHLDSLIVKACRDVLFSGTFGSHALNNFSLDEEMILLQEFVFKFKGKFRGLSATLGKVCVPNKDEFNRMIGLGYSRKTLVIQNINDICGD